MEESTLDFEQIEQELRELRTRFSRADEVLRSLEAIQAEFEGLAETHKTLREYVIEVSRFNSESNNIINIIKQAQENFEQHFTQLREENELKLDDLKSEISEEQKKLTIYDSHIQSYIKGLKDDFNYIKNDLDNWSKQIKDSTNQELFAIEKKYDLLNKRINTMGKIITGLTSVIILLFVVFWLK